MKISHEFVAMAHTRGATKDTMRGPSAFAPYKPAPGVLPSPALAMDSNEMPALNWAASALYGNTAEGQQFLGYPELSILAQRPEYRIISETFAMEMTRKWIDITSDEEDRAEKIAVIESELDRLNARAKFREVAEHDGFFGRGHLFPDFGDDFDSDELKTNIGNGKNAASVLKCKGKEIKALRTVEPMWVYPAQFNAINPLAGDFYKPQSWYVMGREVHVSRLWPFIGREVPDILKAAYAFGGLSMTQMAKPYVDNWLETRQGVNDIIQSFTTFVLKTKMEAILNGDSGESLMARLDAFNGLRNNRGIMALDKELEDFVNVSAPLGSLDHLQAQALEHLCVVCKMPLVKLTGITPSGLNASSEGELQCWDDTVRAYQESLYRPHLTRLINFIQISKFGEVDPSIKFDFAPLRELTEDQCADVATKVTTAVMTAHSDGLIDTATALEELKKSSDVTGIFASISQDAIDEARANPEPPGGMPEAPGPGEQPGQPGQEQQPQEGGDWSGKGSGQEWAGKPGEGLEPKDDGKAE
jgi:phage-related protein (TIGR01555 family)